MNKKFFSAMLFGLFTLGIATTFVSCKDYDDDIDGLQTQVTSVTELANNLSTLVENLKSELAQAKSDLQAAQTAAQTATTAAQEATTAAQNASTAAAASASATDVAELQARCSQLETRIAEAEKAIETLKSEKADASDVEAKYEAVSGKIETLEGANELLDLQIKAINNFLGTCKINGTEVDTNVLQALADAIAEAKTQEAADFETQKQQIEDLYSKLETQVSKTDVEAIWAELNCLFQDLRSMVYMPYLYVGGIESIEYPFLADTVLIVNPDAQYTQRPCDGVVQNITIPANADYAYAATTPVTVFPLAIGVDYHMNPSNAPVEYGDLVQKYVVREAEVISRAASTLDVTTQEKTNGGKQTIFQNKNGVLTAGLKVNDAKWLVNKANGVDGTPDYIVALQANTKSTAKQASKVITSDYAMLYPEKEYVEGLAYIKATNKNFKLNTVDEEPENCENRTGEADHQLVDCPVKTNEFHLWNTPEEALLHTPDFAVYCKDPNGVNLSEYLGVHVVREGKTVAAKANQVKVLDFGCDEQDELGISYEFLPVYYTVGTNGTSDTKYCKINSATGNITAYDVDAKGETTSNQTESSVGRQPLVQVLVKVNGKVIIDGYILVDITPTPTPGNEPVTVNVYDFPGTKKEFDLCNALTLNQAGVDNTWAEFDTYILDEDTLVKENMTKEMFDNTFLVANWNGIATVDRTDASWNSVNNGGCYVLNAKIYTKGADGKYTAHQPGTGYGELAYIYDEDGTTNHCFTWTISEEEIESYLHDGKSKDMTIYMCYDKLAGSSAVEKIWVKITTTITRKQLANATWKEKINEYWYGNDGNDEGKEAIVFDIKEPRDGETIPTTEWNSSITSTLKGNKLAISGATNYKYYFAPVNSTITDQDGTVWTITTESDDLRCKYVQSHKHKYSELPGIINECTIDYTWGVFNNVTLTAKSAGRTEVIAELNPTNGQVTLTNNYSAKKVLNAIGYEANHTNILKELHATVGIAAGNSCDVAVYVEDGTFTTSWQRPINLDAVAEQPAIDAKTNKNIIYLVDILKMYDWRGATVGYMWGDQTWFWAYYGVNSITVDCRPSVVETNMHQSSTSKFVKLNTITTESQLYPLGGATGDVKTYNFNISSYNYESKNADLLTYMEEHKDEFGAIVYDNNGDNVTKFTIKVPVTVGYTWGEFKTVVSIVVDRTTGH